MVYVEDEGSTFDAPIEFVWKYIFDDQVHGAAHTTTRNQNFKKVSDVTFTFVADRQFRGTWAPHKMRISMFPPVSVVTEWLEGVLAGSKVVYVYAPRGEKTSIDVYGEFSSKTLPEQEVEAAAREWLDGEFGEDAPMIRKARQGAR